jgi:5-methylcytosine-specific restriction endonuclease McrA
MIEKDKRWINKKYTNWVATLPCTNCGTDDGTVVAHHLKHRFFPWGGGGIGMKAHDWLTMALCYTCHAKAHNGDSDILDFQMLLIWKTQREAFKQGVLDYVNK